MASPEVLLLASGDQRLSANQNCWAAQRDMEQRLAAAVSAQGYALRRAHPFKEAEGHGFLASQREGIETFRTIPPDAPIIVADIFRTIGELRAAVVSILLVEQNAQAALQIADRAYVMELGEFILNGPASDIAANKRVAASYLGFGDEGESAV